MSTGQVIARKTETHEPRGHETHEAHDSQDGHAAHKTPHKLHPPERKIAIWGPLLIVTALAILLVIGVWNHVMRNQAEQNFEKANADTVVNVLTVHPEAKPIDLVLPGSVDANQATTLYARSNGFLGKWFVDIGDHVKKGQVLAQIETPDVDQQLQQAQSSLSQAKANFEIARVTAVRWQQLYMQKVVSAQDNDQQQASYQAAAGAQAAAQANVNQLQQLVAFNQIVAPFDGTITFRYLDVGALVTQGSGSAGTKIYDLAETDPLLIYVYVPQTNAPMIHPGVTARLVVSEYPDRNFTATVTRTAGAIDPNSRTLLTELQIPNPEGTLYAGMYGEIEFTLYENGKDAPIMIPANAFMFRTQGPQVVVVRDNKTYWQTVQLGRDLGTELQSMGGLKDGDMVVVNPGDNLYDGLQVKTQPAPVDAPAGAAAPAAGASPAAANSNAVSQLSNGNSKGIGAESTPTTTVDMSGKPAGSPAGGG